MKSLGRLPFHKAQAQLRPPTRLNELSGACPPSRQNDNPYSWCAFRFLYGPRLTRAGAAASIRATMSSMVQSVLATPAAIAGDTFTALLMRAKLYQTV